ncbi:RagB/SusD family nutrient uptake outer membrane protein [Pedobacter sp. SD-b]|uniref:RagB/SusD family nutrient uptake outer membrane protein n=1 Tax=Pedobacter segetis TaxID=2793069 RepID=A0ABS1BHM6_9SPHI|nr:RagB/SusD family nutrient uptake outer membrane protein [Pedobacter segetis]MBK0382350.1 RagB/SusD family nutrient uptake outer membrane protein [Pedobacter segetis]
MKNIKYITLVLIVMFTASSCEKIIDIDPISNNEANLFYKNYAEINVALTGCYNGMQEPLYNEWMFTELRGDNVKQGVPNSTSTPNIELNDLDEFTLNSSHSQVYTYWLASYKNIRSINYVLRSLGVTYSNGTLTIGDTDAEITAEQKNQIIGQALFLRAYHYFKLTRLFGGVFLITEPLDPKVAKQINRSSVTDCYALITADLLKAKDLLSSSTFGSINTADLGRANAWAAKSLLAKVYLTLHKNSDALPLLNDVINNSGYGLLNSYADVFSINNEMNKEILFAVRYKAGGYGLGSPFANLFAPTGSGNAVVNNDGSGYDFPTESIKKAYRTPATGGIDQRKAVSIAQFTASRPYCKKFTSQVISKYDAENDFPIIRFADVLLMKAEAEGFNGSSGSSVNIINQIRARSGAVVYPGTVDFTSAFYQYPSTGSNSISDDASFKTALFNERRLELAFENQRFFDMVRSGDAVALIRAYFAEEYAVHYKNYTPTIPLATLQGFVTEDRLLLPIPLREIDTNNQIQIAQNPSY